MKRFVWAAGLVLLSLGCASRDAAPVNFSVRNALGEQAELFTSAENALLSLGYTIARRSPAEGVIVSEPIPLENTGQRTVGADDPQRKVAEVRIAGSGADTTVRCRVTIEEQATESYRMLAMARSGDDVPGHQTAIDRDAATTSAQNTVWRTVRRDRTAERQILDRIVEPADQP